VLLADTIMLSMFSDGQCTHKSDLSSSFVGMDVMLCLTAAAAVAPYAAVICRWSEQLCVGRPYCLQGKLLLYTSCVQHSMMLMSVIAACIGYCQQPSRLC